MSPIRVLVVDDAVVIRRIVTDVLSADPDIQVIGTAANGKIAMAKIPQLNPDLVTLDVEMPEMDGLATLREIRKFKPRLPVIMFSTLTARGAETTLDALAAGANDYVTKPANVGSVSTAMTRIRDELIPRIKALTVRATAPITPKSSPAFSSVPTMPASARGPIKAVLIGVSTGGPNALADVIPHIPAGLPVPVFIVQHMPPVFTRLLADRLAAKAQLPVTEAVDNEPIVPGHIYIAPGDFHMTISRDRRTIHLNKEMAENSCRPAVDVLFRSAASAYGSSTLAVVLTGMGQDGLLGGKAIRQAGGRVIVQDEATSVVWGMPGAIARDGLAEKQLPLSMIAPEITRLVLQPSIATKISA